MMAPRASERSYRRWLRFVVDALLVFVAVTAAVVVGGFVVHLAFSASPSDLDKAERLGKGLGILALFAGVLFAGWRSFTAQRQVQASEQGQVTERFTKAIEHLASEGMTIRLGGVYALERIAQDSPRDHSTIFEVLSSYLRQYTWGSEGDRWEKLPEDAQAICTVISRRNPSHDKYPINLAFADLRGATFESADLRGANLGQANLEGSGWSHCDLRGAKLWGAKVRNSEVKQTDMGGVDLTQASLDGTEFQEVDFSGAKLLRVQARATIFTETNLTRQQLSEIGAINPQTKLPPHLDENRGNHD